jgi:eukaryotic-like serine/threonine-protein kinase
MGADDRPPGQLVAGRYDIVGVLGRGGMGVVWLAEDRLLERQVALKEVTFSMALGDEERRVLRERTLREARAAARLHHPCVTALFDVVEEDGKPWLVMERVAARSVQEIVEETGPLHPRDVARIGLDVLAALEAAHAAGIVHRDVKPANVLVGPDGHAHLTDFGIATSTGDPSLTGGALIGSPPYMAPERVNGEEPRPPVDLWSLGATLYTAVEGRRAFDRPESFATLVAVVSEEPAPMRLAGPLEPVLRGLLTKDPAQRSTIEQARGGLEAVLGEDAPPPAAAPPTTEAPAPEAPTPDEDPPPRRFHREPMAVLDREDLRALAAASRAVLGSVVKDAREQAVSRAQQRRSAVVRRRTESAEQRRTFRQAVGRRLRRILLAVVLLVLLLVAGVVLLLLRADGTI